jgi:signal transduction histidine kinase
MSKVNFQISSRATILLGRENIAKAEGAIIELIKNTYDADASLCYILLDSDHDVLYIFDNGTGMTQEIVKDNWMLIGTENKRKNYISDKRRIKSGEKGIGRFALDRLGGICEMYTKTADSSRVLYWKANWSDFEKSGKMINDIEADLDYIDNTFQDVIPTEIINNISYIDKELSNIIEGHSKIEFEGGTILKISQLRDIWDKVAIDKLIESLNYLIPPVNDSFEYNICLQRSLKDKPILIENKMQEEYDYKIEAEFTGEIFNVKLYRNEFDVHKIPEEVFKEEFFNKYPYTKKDFENGIFYYTYTIGELLKFQNDDNISINKIREIGPFQFNYSFMKIIVTRKEDYSKFFYKELSKNRKIWLEQNAGVRIYRDNFLVRPYGDPTSDSFDWLNLDARNALDPAGIGNRRKSWTVHNAQGQGTIHISRLNNEVIIDKSSREGIIDNEHFKLFKNVIKELIHILEVDRAEIGYAFSESYKIRNESETIKELAEQISKEYKKNKNSKNKSEENGEKETLLKALDIAKQEKEDLISELKVMRSLSTNGLITTAIVHDLKTISANFNLRSDSILKAVEKKRYDLFKRLLSSLNSDDKFLSSWIQVITNQVKKDKRTRKMHNLYDVILASINLIVPILEFKNIRVNIEKDNNIFRRKVFETDFDSILYNLIINSVESFERTLVSERIITITMSSDNNNFFINYMDNGEGISKSFKNPYDIFRFSITSKLDSYGKPVGTGLGMYIVDSTIREYNGKYSLKAPLEGFHMEIIIPQRRV